MLNITLERVRSITELFVSNDVIEILNLLIESDICMADSDAGITD